MMFNGIKKLFTTSKKRPVDPAVVSAASRRVEQQERRKQALLEYYKKFPVLPFHDETVPLYAGKIDDRFYLKTSDLRISTRLKNVFKHSDCKLLFQALYFTEAELLRLPNAGQASVSEFGNILLANNLEFGFTRKIVSAYRLPEKELNEKHYQELIDGMTWFRTASQMYAEHSIRDNTIIRLNDMASYLGVSQSFCKSLVTKGVLPEYSLIDHERQKVNCFNSHEIKWELLDKYFFKSLTSAELSERLNISVKTLQNGRRSGKYKGRMKWPNGQLSDYWSIESYDLDD